MGWMDVDQPINLVCFSSLFNTTDQYITADANPIRQSFSHPELPLVNNKDPDL